MQSIAHAEISENSGLTHGVTAPPALSAREGYSGEHETSGGPFHSFLESSAVYLFPFMVLAVLWVSVTHIFHLDLGWTLWLTIPAGWALGDFISGLIHWACDTYGSVKTPIVGEALIRPFRMHHKFPRDITTHDLVITIGNSCIPAVPVLAVFLYYLLESPPDGSLALWAFVFGVIAVATILTNQFHKWAHLERIPSWIAWLQKSRVILSPDHHEKHHKAPFDSHYCITGGWMNYVLEPLRFWRRFERVLSWFGIRVANR